MSNPEIQYNPKKVDYTLADLIKMVKRDVMLSLNCHAIGTIQSFDSSNQTVTVSINYKKTFFQKSSDGVNFIPILKDYPLLVDVPAVVIGGGNAFLTMPIAQGDECLVLFNDRDLSSWFQSGQNGPVPTSRLHSFSDALALVGVRSAPNAIENYDEERAVLRNGDAKIAVDEELIEISNADQNLSTILQSLLTQLQNLTTQLAALTVTGVTTGAGTSGVPTNAAAINTIGTNIGNIASDLGDLLE